MNDYMNIIVAAISGGAITQFLTFFISKKKVNQDDFTLITQQWIKDNERLREDNEELRKINQELREKIEEGVLDKIKLTKDLTDLETDFKKLEYQHEVEIQNLRIRLFVFESSHVNLPLPAWTKDLNGRVLTMNKAYEDSFLIPNNKTIDDYIGFTDIDVWGEEIGKIYQDGDSNALESVKGYWIGKEPINIKGHFISEEWRVLKYVRYEGKKRVGTGGIAIPFIEIKNEK